LGKKPSYRDDKRRLSRTIICILLPNRKANQVIRKQQSSINFAKDQARELINRSIEELSELTDQILPLISLEMPNFYRDSPNLIDGLQNVANRASTARACILQVEIEDNEPPNRRRDLGISHLVAIQLGDKDGGWYSREGISSALIKTTVEKLPLLIHDIALDIATFHSWPFLNESFGSSLEGRIDFSKKKARFAIGKSQETLYGPIHDQNLQYFSIAALSRKGSKFSSVDYLELWEEFISEELLDALPTPLEVPRVDPAEWILKSHHQGGQISERKLRKHVGQLAPGTYLLLMTRKRPHIRKVRARLSALFGRKNYRQGLWIIVAFKEYASNINLLPFISLFKFHVPQVSSLKSAGNK
jgi:hypothetical protein